MKIVLIGASNNSEKYGNKILKDLLNKGYELIPVNPNQTQIEGIKTHKVLSTVPKSFDIINFVVPPKITLQILKKYKDILLDKKVWIQPGAEDDNVKDFLEKNDFKDTITNSCIMLEKIN